MGERRIARRAPGGKLRLERFPIQAQARGVCPQQFQFCFQPRDAAARRAGPGKEAVHRFKAQLQRRQRAQVQAHKAAAHIREGLVLARAAGGTFRAQARKAGLGVHGHVAGPEFALVKEFAKIPRFGGGMALLFFKQYLQHWRPPVSS